MSTGTDNNSTAASRRSVLRAEGFSCPSCVTKIEKQLAAMDGVHNVKVSFATSKIEVEHDPATAVEALVEQVAKAGYKARPSAF
ncbi:MAG: heavy metal-associated domain-containing protein [Trueperaceae bacterium]